MATTITMAAAAATSATTTAPARRAPTATRRVSVSTTATTLGPSSSSSSSSRRARSSSGSSVTSASSSSTTTGSSPIPSKAVTSERRSSFNFRLPSPTPSLVEVKAGRRSSLQFSAVPSSLMNKRIPQPENPSSRALSRSLMGKRSRMRLKLNCHTVYGRSKELRQLSDIIDPTFTSSSLLSSSPPSPNGANSYAYNDDSSNENNIDDGDDENNNNNAASASASPLVVSRNSFVEIFGHAGVGKSSLVHSQLPLYASKGFLFGCGKFEYHKVSQPYDAIITALNQLCDMWASLPKGKSEIFNFLNTVERDWNILKNVIPKVFQKAGINTDYIQGSNTTNTSRDFYRMRLALRRLLNAATTDTSQIANTNMVLPTDSDQASQPQQYHRRRIILFLDDLQWADPCSLKILEALIGAGGSLKGVVLIVAYRDNEITSCQQQFLDTIRSRMTTDVSPEAPCSSSICTPQPLSASPSSLLSCHQIQVGALTLPQVNELMSRVTRKESSESIPLAKVVYDQTGGNAFFIIQFLELLQDDGYLYYCKDVYRWKWKGVQEIRQVMSTISTNITELVTTAMRNMPFEAQEALMVASCLGTRIPVLVVSEYFTKYNNHGGYDTLHDVVLKAFDVCVESRMLVRSQSGGYSSYEFSHDRLRQIAYNMISEQERIEWHVRLGKLICKQLIPAYPECRHWMTFMAADQLDFGADLVTDPDLRIDLAKLHLEAAKLSMTKAAYVSAKDLLYAGVKLLDLSTSWHVAPQQSDNDNNEDSECGNDGNTNRSTYELTCSIYLNIAKVEHVLENYETAKAAALEVLDKSHVPQDKFAAEIMLIQVTKSKVGPEQAMKMALRILSQYGEQIPYNPGKSRVALEKVALKREFPTRRIEELPDLPKTSNKHAIRVSCLLSIVISTAIVQQQHNSQLVHLARFCGLRLHRLTYQYGATSYSILALVSAMLEFTRSSSFDRIEKLLEMCETMLSRFKMLNSSKASTNSGGGGGGGSTVPIPSQLSSSINSTTSSTSTMDANKRKLIGQNINDSNSYSNDILQQYGNNGDHISISWYIIEATFFLVRPFRKHHNNVMVAHHVAMSTSDTQLSTLCQIMYGFTYLAAGLPLDMMESDLKSVSDYNMDFLAGDDSSMAFFPIMQQTLLNLQGKNTNNKKNNKSSLLSMTKNNDNPQDVLSESSSLSPSPPTTLTGDAMDQDLMLSKLGQQDQGSNKSNSTSNKTGNSMVMTTTYSDLCSLRLMLACHFDNPTVAAKMLDELNKIPLSNILPARYCFQQAYKGIASFMVARKLKGHSRYEKIGKKILKEFQQEAEQGFIYAQPIVAMLKAQESNSIERYKKAIKVCTDSGLLHYCALLNEHVAQLLRKSEPQLSKVYITRAFQFNVEWRAWGKVNQLKDKYPHLGCPLDTIFTVPQHSLSGSIKTVVSTTTTTINSIHSTSGGNSIHSQSIKSFAASSQHPYYDDQSTIQTAREDRSY